MQALRAFRQKFPGAEPANINSINRTSLHPTDHIPSDPRVIVTPSNTNHKNSSFGKKDQLLIDAATHCLYQLTGTKKILLTFDCPSKFLAADKAICHNSATIVERLLSFIGPLLNSRHWLCVWERKEKDYLHLHLVVAAPGDQQMPSENLLRQIWTSIIPLEAMQKANSDSYLPSQVHVHIQEQPIFEPDQHAHTYLAKGGPTKRGFRKTDGIKLAPQKRFHVSPDLKALCDAAILTEKIPCTSVSAADQIIDEIKNLLPLPGNDWSEIRGWYRPASGFQTRYSASQVPEIKHLVNDHLVNLALKSAGKLPKFYGDYAVIEIYPSGHVYLKRSFVRLAADRPRKIRAAKHAGGKPGKRSSRASI